MEEIAVGGEDDRDPLLGADLDFSVGSEPRERHHLPRAVEVFGVEPRTGEQIGHEAHALQREEARAVTGELHAVEPGQQRQRIGGKSLAVEDDAVTGNEERFSGTAQTRHHPHDRRALGHLRAHRVGNFLVRLAALTWPPRSRSRSACKSSSTRAAPLAARACARATPCRAHHRS